MTTTDSRPTAAPITASGVAQRLEIANRMFLDAQRMLTLHLTAQHPDWTPEQVQREVAHRISHGLV